MEIAYLIGLYFISALFLVYKLYKKIRIDGIDPPFKENCINALIILLPVNMFVAAMLFGWDVQDWWERKKF